MQTPNRDDRRVSLSWPSPSVECWILTKGRSSLGHIFLKVSTGYDGPETQSILKQMNDLAHFAADVLGDKYQIFDILPFCTLSAPLRRHMPI